MFSFLFMAWESFLTLKDNFAILIHAIIPNGNSSYIHLTKIKISKSAPLLFSFFECFH